MESNTFINPLYVNNYLFLHKKDSQNSKKIKRKFSKKKIDFVLNPRVYQDYNNQVPKLLLNYITELKKNKTLDTFDTIGIVSDKSILLDNITIIPPAPVQWDILCLDSNIKEYDFECEQNNVYWCNTKISNSYNFIINRNNIEVISDILKVSKDWANFISLLNENCKIFSITQYHLSHDADTFIKFPYDIYNSKNTPQEERELVLNTYDKSCSQFLINNKKITMYSNVFATKLDTEKEWNTLPSISLICILSDTNLFFNALYTFLKLDYPRDKLELVIVDDNDYEKKLKTILPDDKRIRIVNLTPKNKNENKGLSIPLGHKLNMGIKYASHNLIYNFFDTDVHFTNKIKDLVKLHVVSNKNCIVSYDHGIYIDDKTSNVYNIPYIGNMLYTKNWWKVCSYDDKQNNLNILLYKFINYRLECVSFVPFLHFGFTPNKTHHTKTHHITSKNFPCSFIKLLDDNGKNSYNITFNNN